MTVSDAQSARVQAQFGAHARFYTTSNVHARGESLARLVDMVQPASRDVVLDVATGAGHTALAFASHVRHVVGLDVTSAMLPEGRLLAQHRVLANVSVTQGDAEHLPFADASFDIVTCRIAPHHFPDVARAVLEMARVCRPGGAVAICDTITPETLDTAAYINAFEMRRDPSHHWAYALEDWRQFFTQAGLALAIEETVSKTMQLTAWATQFGVTEERVFELRQELVHAPPDVQDFLKPRMTADDEVEFELTEGLFLARK